MNDVEHPERPAQSPKQDPEHRDTPHAGSTLGPDQSDSPGAPGEGPLQNHSNDDVAAKRRNGPAKPVDGGRKRPGDAAKSSRPLLTWFMLALLAALVGSSLMLPWKILGLIFGIAALVLGIMVLVKAARAGLSGLVRVSTIAGLAAAAFLVVGTGASVLLWPITETYEDCMSTALTLQAERGCEDGLQNFNGLLTPN